MYVGSTVEILEPLTFAFLLIGAMLPYWFSAMTMKSVGKAAMEVQCGCFTWLKSVYAYRIRTIIKSMQFVWGFDVCVCDKCMNVCVRWYTKCSVSSQKRPSCWTGTAKCARTTRDACSFPPTPPSSKCLPMLTFIHTFIHGNICTVSITVKHLYIHSVCIHITYIHTHTNREMIAPAALVLLSPLVAGTFFGVHAVYGLLTGALLSGEGIHTHTYK